MDVRAGHTPRQRESVFLLASIAGQGTEVQRLRVRNLSADGICVEKPVELEAGQRVRVACGLIERAAAEVMWVRNGFAGLRFLQPVDTAAARSRPVRSMDPKEGWGRPIT